MSKLRWWSWHLASVTLAGSSCFLTYLPRPCRSCTPLYTRRSRRVQYCLLGSHADCE